MKKFLVRILLYSSIVLIFSMILDFMVSSGLRNMEDYRFQDFDAIMDGGMDYDLLVMGNSRAFSHYNPSILDSICNLTIYNLGIGGYSFNVQYLKWKLYKKYNTRPKYIIQNVDFSTLNTMNVKNQHESEQFLPYMYDPYYNRLMSEVGYSFADCHLPLYRYFGYQQVIKNGLFEFLHIKHYISRPSYKGFYPELGTWNGINLQNMEPFSATMEPSAVNLFETYLQDCRRDSIYVVLVNSPMYVGAIEKCTNYKKFTQYLDSISIVYNIPYLDFTENYELSKDTCNFVVSAHMNLEAANQFTKDLATILNQRILK